MEPLRNSDAGLHLPGKSLSGKSKTFLERFSFLVRPIVYFRNWSDSERTKKTPDVQSDFYNSNSLYMLHCRAAASCAARNLRAAPWMRALAF